MKFHECPGSKTMEIPRKADTGEQLNGSIASQLRQWPIQLHLVSPSAPYYRDADVLLTADCVGYAMGSFHSDHLKDKAIAIACPKLDQGQEAYLEKIQLMIDEGNINTLTVMIMQVPCCSGLLHIVTQAAAQANRTIPIRCLVVSVEGEILRDEWVES